MTAQPSDFRDENGRWKCISCGACCLVMCRMDPAMKKWDRGDGGCKYLTSEMQCEIYATRPHNCRSDKFPHLSDLRLSRYCARYKNVMDEEIARGMREPDGKKFLKNRTAGATETPLPWPSLGNIR